MEIDLDLFKLDPEFMLDVETIINKYKRPLNSKKDIVDALIFEGGMYLLDRRLDKMIKNSDDIYNWR